MLTKREGIILLNLTLYGCMETDTKGQEVLDNENQQLDEDKQVEEDEEEEALEEEEEVEEEEEALEEDDDGDGVPADEDCDDTDPNVTQSFNWRLVEVNCDFNDDEVVDEVWVYEYDEYNSIVSWLIDNDTDEDFEKIWTATHTYDSSGNILSTTVDNHENHTELITYNEERKRISESIDTTGDGIADEMKTYTYDEKGTLLTMSKDNDGDGEIDTITNYINSYDENGVLLSQSHWLDSNANDVNDAFTTITFDAHGNYQRSSIELDMNEDGEIDYVFEVVFINTYDENGLLISTSAISSEDSYTIINTFYYENDCD